MKKILLLTIVLLLCSQPVFSRYNPKYDKAITKEDLVGFVKEAVAYAKIYGKRDALNEYLDKEGLFNRGELYIYAYDFKCIVLSHGSNASLVGKDLSQLEDIKGTKIIQEMVNSLKKNKSGWLKFYWFHPITKRITPKLGYFEQVDKDWWVGSGIYYEENSDVE